MTDNTWLGGTIALPGYQNIKIEVSGDGWSETKLRLKVILQTMCKDPITKQAIELWWLTTFGEPINNYQPRKEMINV